MPKQQVEPDPIKISNDQFVGSNGQGLAVTMPRPMRFRQDVFRHVAWLLECSAVLLDDPHQVDANGDPYTLEQYRAVIRNEQSNASS